MLILAMPAKLDAMQERLGIDNPELFLRKLAEESEIEYRVVKEWPQKERCGLRGHPAKNFCAWFKKKFDLELNTSCSAADFRESLGLPREAPLQKKAAIAQPHGDLPPTSRAAENFVGVYQVIRPHCAAEQSYVLEAMEIIKDGNSFRTWFYSHNQPTRSLMYEGEAHASTRYYFSFMLRPHEELAGYSAFRSVAFHMGDTHYHDCLSGVMLRGMSGSSTRKDAIGLPFLALRIPGARRLDDIDPVRINPRNTRAHPMYRLHSDGHLLIGAVEEEWYGALFDFCKGVFSQNCVKEAFETRHPQIIYTVQQNDLRRIYALSEDNWRGLASSLPEHGTSPGGD